ncbi:MAG: extracellular solute-binding protein, partial [Alphaproteobacteria bacterium]|nr:extracellular solute-binding protein [Alphaproteobacteria bacterium]
PSLADPLWIGNDTYAAVIAWQKSKYGDNGPKNWAEFFDTKKFPGRRAIIDNPVRGIEAALLADGVAPNALYPLDVERGLKKIGSLGKDLAVLWKSGGQSIQLAKDGEVDLLMMYNGRAESAIQDGVKLGFHFNQAIADYSCWAIPKGSKNVAAANKFIAAMISPDIAANLPKHFTYGPVQPKAYEGGRISPERQKQLATSPENMKLVVLQDNAYWLKNQPDAKARWDKFMQSR